MRIFALSAADIGTETIWEDVRELLERFERKTGEISADQVRQGAAREQLQIWGLQDAERVHFLAVTELGITPKGLVCTVRIGVGSARVPMQERLLDAIGAWAREAGCKRVRLVGRPGWLRRFRRLRQTAVVMEWEL